MWSILGYLIFFNAVQGAFSYYIEGNTSYNITLKSSNDNFKWTKDGTEILTVFFNNASNDCYNYPPVQDYRGYCMRDGGDVKYVLEILNTSLHDEAVFTGPQTIQVRHVGTKYSNFSGSILTDQQPIDVEYGVSCTKPEPEFQFNITMMNLTITYTVIQTTEDCSGHILVKKAKNYHGKVSLESSILKQSFPSDVDWIKDIKNITVKIYFIYDGRTSELVSQVIDFVYLGPPSSPPTPSASTSLQPTSSAPNPSTKVSSESSTSPTPTPTPTPKCEDLICVCDQICIIIICVCVGSLIIIVVIILCCCCCPFCPCYKRRKKKHEGTECKCCGLICVCCRPNNKDHDEESEGRAKVCESCCCLFSVCYKRKKKSGDRNSNPNKKKSASRSQQHEMPRTNHPDGMHSYSGYQVNRPDERARVNQPAVMNYNVSRPDQPARVYQPADINYHVRRPDQQARVYQPAPATGYTPNDSRYGQGYNNAAYMHHGENERRNMDRKSRVTQRPYTKHY